jgi:hypothetical protein
MEARVRACYRGTLPAGFFHLGRPRPISSAGWSFVGASGRSRARLRRDARLRPRSALARSARFPGSAFGQVPRRFRRRLQAADSAEAPSSLTALSWCALYAAGSESPGPSHSASSCRCTSVLHAAGSLERRDPRIPTIVALADGTGTRRPLPLRPGCRSVASLRPCRVRLTQQQRVRRRPVTPRSGYSVQQRHRPPLRLPVVLTCPHAVSLDRGGILSAVFRSTQTGGSSPSPLGDNRRGLTTRLRPGARPGLGPQPVFRGPRVRPEPAPYHL